MAIGIISYLFLLAVATASHGEVIGHEQEIEIYESGVFVRVVPYTPTAGFDNVLLNAGGGQIILNISADIFTVSTVNQTFTDDIRLEWTASWGSAIDPWAVEITGLSSTPNIDLIDGIGILHDGTLSMLISKRSSGSEEGSYSFRIHQVPEPSTFLLAGLGLGIVGVVTRKRRRQAP